MAVRIPLSTAEKPVSVLEKHPSAAENLL